MDCYDLLLQHSNAYLAQTKSKPSHINYRFNNDSLNKYTLEYLLKNNKFELGYSILYVDNIATAFGGIRQHDKDTTIIAARAFCYNTPKLVLNKIMIPFHLSISKQRGNNRAIITFNKYNRKIYDLWPIFTKMKNLIDYKDLQIDPDRYLMEGIRHINNTDQYVIQWMLTDN